MKWLKSFLDIYKNLDNIVIYGSGVRAKKLYVVFKRNGISVHVSFVTDYNGKDFLTQENIRVTTIGDYIVSDNHFNLSELNVIVDIYDSEKEIPNLLYKYNFKSCFFISDQLNQEISFYYYLNNALDDYYAEKHRFIVDYSENDLEQTMVVLKSYDKKRPVIRLFGVLAPENIAFIKMLEKDDILSREIGDVFFLPSIVNADERNESERYCLDVKIYTVTTERDSFDPGDAYDPWLVPLQAGVALSTVKKQCFHDNIGDNISDRNRDYCECTGLYWIWKNTGGQDYVGLQQYRRRLEITQSNLCYISKNGIDAILALPQATFRTVKDFFVEDHATEKDWELMKKFIIEYDEGYRDIVDSYDDRYLYYSCNLFVFRREWFDRYCEFAFSVSEKIWDYYEKRGIKRENRFMGYLFENLHTLFILRHRDEMKIVHTGVKWIDYN